MDWLQFASAAVVLLFTIYFHLLTWHKQEFSSSKSGEEVVPSRRDCHKLLFGILFVAGCGLFFSTNHFAVLVSFCGILRTLKVNQNE